MRIEKDGSAVHLAHRMGQDSYKIYKILIEETNKIEVAMSRIDSQFCSSCNGAASPSR